MRLPTPAPHACALSLLLACVLPAVAASAAPAATAPAALTAPADPTDTRAAVPQLDYRSGLRSYRPWREQALSDWRVLNDEVTRIGGWRTYLREAQQPDPPAALPSAQPARAGQGTPVQPGAARPPLHPAPGPHGAHVHGHGTHGPR